MKILSEKRCVIGEGPVWNSNEEKLHYTNGFGKELCMYDFKTQKIKVRALPFDVAAFAFGQDNALLISHTDGVHILNGDNSLKAVYDNARYTIRYANDMKVGPDGAIYVGTMSAKRKGVSNEVDGKLYRISPNGEVRELLDNLQLSNGMEWSLDETKFYHTDSDDQVIKEYHFYKSNGNILFTGRQVRVDGVDGFTIGLDNRLYVACWGYGHIAVVNAETLSIVEYIKVPCQIPTSCGFSGENMDILAITTASCKVDIRTDENAGFTFLKNSIVCGRKPYIYGGK